MFLGTQCTYYRLQAAMTDDAVVIGPSCTHGVPTGSVGPHTPDPVHDCIIHTVQFDGAVLYVYLCTTRTYNSLCTVFCELA